MSGVKLAIWVSIVIRGGVYLTQVSFKDADGNPIATLDASFIGTPEGGSPFTWDSGNNLFINIGVGIYRFNLLEADTAALAWDSGTYRIEVVDVSGFTFPCFIDGLMFVRDC